MRLENNLLALTRGGGVTGIEREGTRVKDSERHKRVAPHGPRDSHQLSDAAHGVPQRLAQPRHLLGGQVGAVQVQVGQVRVVNQGLKEVRALSLVGGKVVPAKGEMGGRG